MKWNLCKQNIGTCAMTFIYTIFYVLCIATITIQYKRIPEDNNTDVFGLIKYLQDIADRNEALRAGVDVDEDDSAAATDDDLKVGADYENWEDVNDEYTQNPQYENILRWLPKRHRIKKQSKIEEMEAERAERNKLKARAQNAERAAYVINWMKTNYWTTLYLWGEVSRIIRERQLFDDMRQMIQTVEEEGNEQLRESVLACYRRLKRSLVSATWENKNTNNLVIHHVKHPDHDGIIS